MAPPLSQYGDLRRRFKGGKVEQKRQLAEAWRLDGARQHPVGRPMAVHEGLTLMMTFSPMSMRPSRVAEPICGRSVDLASFASLTQLRRDRRLMLEDVKPRTGEFARLEHLDQRLLVDDLPARRVDEDRARAADISAAAPTANG